MWFRNGLRVLLLLFLAISSMGLGWKFHNYDKQRIYKRDSYLGQELRSKLSAQVTARRQINWLKNQQETSEWEIAELRNRLSVARAELSGVKAGALPRFDEVQR